jgi:hypothetical protein
VTSTAATLTVAALAGPGIQVSSSSINFGNDPVGTNTSQALIISNTGTATLSISQVTISGSTAFTVGGYSLPLSISAGQKTTITANFLPASIVMWRRVIQCRPKSPCSRIARSSAPHPPRSSRRNRWKYLLTGDMSRKAQCSSCHHLEPFELPLVQN